MSGTETPVFAFLNHWARDLGGAELSLLDVMRHMAARAECHLITSEPGRLVDRAAAFGVRCHVVASRRPLTNLRREKLVSTALTSWKGVLAFCWSVVRTRAILLRVKPDVIHANVPKSHVALFLLARLGCRAACCFHVRELFAPRSAPAALYALLFPRRNAKVIAISEAVRASLPPRLLRRAVTIYNGVDVPPRRAHDVNADRLQFIYLGRVVPWKRCDLIVAAFAHLVASYPGRDLRLSLVGGTLYWPVSYRDEVQARIDGLGVSSRCVLLDHADDPYAALLSNDVFCTASVQEPFGRAAAEAMACGLPVVGFDGGGIAEIVQHGTTGLLVAPGDVAALAHAMGRFVEDPALVKNMGERGYHRAQRLFNREIQIPVIGDFLRAMAGSQQESKDHDENRDESRGAGND